MILHVVGEVETFVRPPSPTFSTSWPLDFSACLRRENSHANVLHVGPFLTLFWDSTSPHSKQKQKSHWWLTRFCEFLRLFGEFYASFPDSKQKRWHKVILTKNWYCLERPASFQVRTSNGTGYASKTQIVAQIMPRTCCALQDRGSLHTHLDY